MMKTAVIDFTGVLSPPCKMSQTLRMSTYIHASKLHLVLFSMKMCLPNKSHCMKLT